MDARPYTGGVLRHVAPFEDKTVPQPPRLTLQFSKTTIDALTAPPSGRLSYYDLRVPGLAITVTATGAKSFYLVRRVGRAVERLFLGKWPKVTIDQARNAAMKFTGEIAAGHNPADSRRALRSSPAFGVVFEQFLATPTRTKAKRVRSPKTIANYRYLIDHQLKHLETRPLTQISRGEMERLHNELGAKHGHYLANRALSVLKAVYEYAVENGLCQVNPAARMRKFEETARERFLQADEFPRFWQALEDEPSENLRDFFKIALLTGQRKGNLLAMRWTEVNLERGIWEIPRTKTGNRHTVPLTEEAVAILKRRQQAAGDAEFVFPGRHHGHLKDPYNHWRRIRTRAGLPDLRIHDLRRSMGSWQARTGASLPIVGKTLGHVRPETTAIYARLDHDPVRKAMEVATAAMMKAAKPKAKDDESAVSPMPSEDSPP